MRSDPHAALRDAVLATVLNGPGASDPAIRRAAFDGANVPANVQTLVGKIHRHAYEVTDNDVARPQAEYGDDQLFEIIVSAALGASHQRLIAALAALEDGGT